MKRRELSPPNTERRTRTVFRKLVSTRMQVDTCQKQLAGQARAARRSEHKTVGTQDLSRATGACDEPEPVQILESGERARAWY